MQENPWEQSESTTPPRPRWWSSRILLILFLGIAVLVGLIFFWQLMLRHTDDLDEDNIPVIMATGFTKERPAENKALEGDSVYSLISKEKSGKTALIIEDEKPVIETINMVDTPSKLKSPSVRDTILMEEKSGGKTKAGVYVQIGSLASREGAEREMKRLIHKFNPLIQKNNVVISEKIFPGKGVYHRIHVGPFDTKEKAKSICQKLSDKGGACFIIH